MFNGMYAAQQSQDFLFGNAEVETSGNPLAHAILRGGQDENGKNHPNYYTDNLLESIEIYEKWVYKIHLLLLILIMITLGRSIWNK